RRHGAQRAGKETPRTRRERPHRSGGVPRATVNGTAALAWPQGRRSRSLAELTNEPVWLITGCSSGFGRELARVVLERGRRVVVTARDVRAHAVREMCAEF